MELEPAKCGVKVRGIVPEWSAIWKLILKLVLLGSLGKIVEGCAVRTKPQTADASRDIIWQGNCHPVDKQLCRDSACSNLTS